MWNPTGLAAFVALVFLAFTPSASFSLILTEEAGILSYETPEETTEYTTIQGDTGREELEGRCISGKVSKTHIEAIIKCSSKFRVPVDHLVGALSVMALKKPKHNMNKMPTRHPESIKLDQAKLADEIEATYKQLVSTFRPHATERPTEDMEAITCFGVCVNKHVGLLHENGAANHDFIRERLNEITDNKMPPLIGEKIIQNCHTLSEFRPEDMVSDNPTDADECLPCHVYADYRFHPGTVRCSCTLHNVYRPDHRHDLQDDDGRGCCCCSSYYYEQYFLKSRHCLCRQNDTQRAREHHTQVWISNNYVEPNYKFPH